MDITINDWSIRLEMTHLTILSNGTFSQVEQKKKISLVKMAKRFLVKEYISSSWTNKNNIQPTYNT
jgi:hypothetical protein